MPPEPPPFIQAISSEQTKARASQYLERREEESEPATSFSSCDERIDEDEDEG